MKRSIIILLTTLALASCVGGSADGTNDTAAQLDSLKSARTEIDKKIAALEEQMLKDNPASAVPVAVKAVTPEAFKSYIEVQAAVTGDENVVATPKAGGVVQSINVRTGQFVNKGQILATLDAAAVDQQLKAQEAQLTLTKQLYEKQSKLWSQNIGSEVQLLTAKANYESTLKQYESLQAQRDMYRIISPIAGTVDAINVKVGDATMPGAFGIRVVSFSKMKVETTLGENYIGKVHTGDKVILDFDETDTEIDSKLSYVSKSVDAISRAFNVEVWLGSRKDITPNMSCKMKILSYENTNALVIPVSSIQKTANGEMVFIVKDGKAKSVIIKSGRIANGMAEVLEGLNSGDKVITEGYAEVDNGRQVDVL
ncbi:MAG: efflux RND transporter periplasmic adaptor subunit [Chitinophagales bacterium]|nr:efflux RND transporter periplasmic adaptor subunit [Chitinophagaceae bacterium]MCB9065478.1 efflux RND transporter periplasmic adaptor subunit [Chitinophagales bacterium]